MLTMNDAGLFVLCALTSALTSVIGVGGGMTLLATLPNVLAPNLVIPIHGATQLISNLSRLALDWRLVAWRLIVPFLPGALIGAGLAGRLIITALAPSTQARRPIIALKRADFPTTSAQSTAQRAPSPSI